MSHGREELREAISDQVKRGDADAAEAVCIGFVVIAEFALPDGESMLSRTDGDAAGERLPVWRRQGLLFNALHYEEGWEEADAPEGEDE